MSPTAPDGQLRVLHIITSLSTGGAEVMLQKLVGALDRTAYSCSVVSLTTLAPIGTELQAEGFQVSAAGGRGGILLPAQFRTVLRAYRQAQPDIVHSWMYHANVTAQVLSQWPLRHPKPGLILSIRGALHASGEQKLALRMVRKIDARLSHRAQAIVFNSRRSADQHAALGYDRDKTTVIPNCFDTVRFQPSGEERARVRQQLGCQDRVLVGLVARFDRMKGHREFLQAARLVANADPRCRFLLAGRGCDNRNATLMSWVRELGLTDLLYLLGERRDMAAIDNALDIAVCSSISESFPNAIGEAMACGIPSVVTDVGDCDYLVGDTGYVAPPRDPRALADSIIRMAALPDSARATLGAAARQRILSEFAIEPVVQRFSRLYDSCGRRS